MFGWGTPRRDGYDRYEVSKGKRSGTRTLNGVEVRDLIADGWTVVNVDETPGAGKPLSSDEMAKRYVAGASKGFASFRPTMQNFHRGYAATQRTKGQSSLATHMMIVHESRDENGRLLKKTKIRVPRESVTVK